MAEPNGSRVRVFIDNLDAELVEEIQAIPGVRVWKGTILAPDHAAWIVEDLAKQAGRVSRVVVPKSSAVARDARLAIPWLHPMVVEPGFLTSYQREGPMTALRWPNESGLLVWSAGSGKTLAGLLWLLSRGPAVNVIVTKAGIRPSWTRQIAEYTRGIEVRTLEGEKPDAAILADLPRDRPTLFVTGYDTLPTWIGPIEKLQPRAIVLDEVHRAKSHARWDAQHSWEEGASKPSFSLKDNQAAACYRLSRIARHRLGLTATPIRDRVRDLWAQLDLVRPWDFGGFYQFAKRYCAASENPWGGMDTRGSSNLGELKKRLTYLVHNVPHSLANRSLPPARRLVTYVPVRDQARATAIAADMRAAMKRGPTAIVEMRLMEAASRKRKIIVDHVLDAIEGGLKIVIFTGRRCDVEVLCDAIHDRAGSCPLWSGTGSDSPELREQMRREYMASPGPAVLVGTGEAWGEGLDLQDTDLAILAMLPYTPGQVIQYEGRFVRLGMKRPVLIRYFVAEGTIDEHVSSILLGKLPAIERTVDLDEVRGLTEELTGDEDELIMSLANKILGTGS